MARGDRPAGAIEWNDRLNPILVRETRRSLRSKLFLIVFVLTLILALFVGATTLMNTASIQRLTDARLGGGSFDMGTVQFGRPFFEAVWICMLIAICGFVPFSSFFTMSAERDENTFELLSLATLRPHQIVIGKLWSLMIQAGLFYSAFLPFLVVGYLLGGLDIRAVLSAVALSALAMPTLCAVGIMLSSIPGPKAARSVLMIAFVGMIFGTCALLFALVEDSMRGRGPLTRSGALETWAILIAIFANVFLYAVAYGGALLTHEEENRSTVPRILSLVSVTGWVVFAMVVLSDAPRSRDAWQFGFTVLYFLSWPWALYVTEPERLGRRSRHRIPGNRVAALLSIPLLPGGGRGYLSLLLMTAAVLGVFTVGGLWIGDVGDSGVTWTEFRERLSALVACTAYAWVYFGLTSAFTTKLVKRFAGRVLALLLIPLTVSVSFFLPVLEGLASGSTHDLFEHAGNPLYLPLTFLNDWMDFPDRWFWLGLMIFLGVLVALLNGPRMLRGVSEVLEASAAQRQRERIARDPVEPTSQEGFRHAASGS